MGSTSIRVSEEAKHRLDLLKREGESYEDVIMRLTHREKWTGFGALSAADGNTRESMKRVRESMRGGITEDIQESDEC